MLYHFRYEVSAYAIKTQGVSFILFVSKETLSRINPAFVMMSLDRRHVWDVVNIVYSWQQWRTQECLSGGFQQIQLRTEERGNGDLWAAAP